MKLSFLTALCVICNDLKTKSGISGKDFGMKVQWASSLLPFMNGTPTANRPKPRVLLQVHPVVLMRKMAVVP